MQAVPEIKKLDEAVINRIAAGEVIQRPANALKEMIENSLDAKSTNIQISVRNGGLKLLQIQDNGIGIRKEDFEIVCERFTTSKLREFEDLNSIATYGFRGEALASISHVAHLTIQSKTAAEKCAYKASYVDGKMQGIPKPAAGNQGTQITVEDLFYNMSVRKKALRSPAEEYQKISEVVSKYAIHNSKVGFCLKKSGENIDIRTPVNSNYIDNIRIIYGNTIARELVEFNMENEPFKFKVSGYMTNVNYSTKKFVFLLFINHRLVDCQILKRSIDQVYSTYLPKNTHPFVYLSLEIEPKCIDVNVHPTKHEVHFLHEEQIVELISTSLETKLLSSNNSRMFYTQAKLPCVITETVKLTDKENKTILPKEMIRTDCNEQKLEKFFGNAVRKSDITSADLKNKPTETVSENRETIEEHAKCLENGKEALKNTKPPETVAQDDGNKGQEDSFVMDVEACGRKNDSFENRLLNETNELNGTNKTNENVPCGSSPKPISSSIISRISKFETQLTSVLELRQQIEDNCHSTLRELFSQQVFVGCVDPTRSLIQHSTKLYLCNTQKIAEELFYQILLYDFQNYGMIKFSNPLPIYDLALCALDLPETQWTPEDGDKKELAQKVAEILTEKGEMLNEYFSMDIDENGRLTSIPYLIDKHTPEISGLPLYVLRLATEVNWETEKECFDSFCRETAMYYSQMQAENEWKWVTEHVIYSTVKERFLPSKKFVQNAAVLQIADLPSLYKVFERC